MWLRGRRVPVAPESPARRCGAVRGLLYDAHSRFGAPSAAYELPRETSSAPFGCPATAERLRTLEAVVERTRALGVEVRCELSAHREYVRKASES